MDKGYDSEKIHALIREEIKAESIIPLRVRKRKKIKGKYRKQFIQAVILLTSPYLQCCDPSTILYVKSCCS